MRMGVDFPTHDVVVNGYRQLPRVVSDAVLDEVAGIVANQWRTVILPEDTGVLRAAVAAGRSAPGVASVWARTPYASYAAAMVRAAEQTLRVVNSASTRRQAEQAALRAIRRLERGR